MVFWKKCLVFLAGLYGAAGVGLAAWAAHRSGGDILMTAAYFFLLHAGPMLALGLAAPSRAWLIGGSILATGTLLFSGDLALRLTLNLKPWAMAAPTGGSLLIVGWLWLAACCFLPQRKDHAENSA